MRQIDPVWPGLQPLSAAARCTPNFLSLCPYFPPFARYADRPAVMAEYTVFSALLAFIAM
jgi:hypothetical protein